MPAATAFKVSGSMVDKGKEKENDVVFIVVEDVDLESMNAYCLE
jgi:hypothetical protein